MKFNDVLRYAYRVATALIAGGFLMLCQPLSVTLFSLGFPILMVGVILFLILDHIPEKHTAEEST